VADSVGRLADPEAGEPARAHLGYVVAHTREARTTQEVLENRSPFPARPQAPNNLLLGVAPATLSGASRF
jgi:hypothetical protein